MLRQHDKEDLCIKGEIIILGLDFRLHYTEKCHKTKYIHERDRILETLFNILQSNTIPPLTMVPRLP